MNAWNGWFADTFCILAVYANEEQTLKRFV